MNIDTKNQIIKRVIKTLLLTILCFSSFTTAQAKEEQQQGMREVLKDFFTEPFETSEPSGECRVRCRIINPKYVQKGFITKIIDFDATTGVTTCDVLPKNSLDSQLSKMSIMANHKDTNCQKNYDALKPDYKSQELASVQYMNTHQDNSTKVTVGEEYDRNKITLSKMLAGVASMDQDIIDLEATKSTGEFTRTNGASQDTYLMNSKKPEEINTANDNSSSGQGTTTSNNSSDRLYDISDKISKENLGFYADLIYYLDKLRDYSATYLLVFLSLGVFAWLASKYIFKKVSKKPTTYDAPWSWKIFSIVVAMMIFFLGIRYDDNYSSTAFLNISQYALDESTSVADRANMIAMKVLMQHEFNKTGASGVETEANLTTLRDKQEYLKTQYEPLLKQCSDRFPSVTTFQETNPVIISNIEELSGIPGTSTDLIYKGCRAIEKRYKVAITGEEQLNYMLNRIKSAYSDDTVAQKLKEIDEYMNGVVKNYGWLSVVLAPTVDVLVDVAFMQNMNKDSVPISAKEGEVQDKMFEAKTNEANDTKIAKHEGDQVGGNALANKLIGDPSFQQKMGEMFGNFTQTLNPLYKSLNDFISNQLVSTDVLPLLGMSHTTKESLSAQEQTDIKVASQSLSIIILERMNKLAPQAFASIAASVKIIMYYYGLIVFLLISPYAVLLAITTGENKKIIDFLVHGIVLFLTPPVITISVYFALFLGQEFDDIFMSMLDEQIRLSLISSASFWGVLSLTSILGFIKVFAVFAKCIIMWRVIMQMPSLVFKMVGLDRGDGTSQVGDAINNSLTKHLK